MKKVTYNKLIRDNIPEIIRATGKLFEIKTLTKSEYQSRLLQKLIEEAEEINTCTVDELAEEIADLYEVVDVILLEFNLDESFIRKTQIEKRNKRGEFDKVLKLIWVEDTSNH